MAASASPVPKGPVRAVGSDCSGEMNVNCVASNTSPVPIAVAQALRSPARSSDCSSSGSFACRNRKNGASSVSPYKPLCPHSKRPCSPVVVGVEVALVVGVVLTVEVAVVLADVEVV